MDKKATFGALVSGAGQTAKELLGGAIHAVDQNDDGKFDLTDVSVMAESMGNAVKKGAQVVKESAEEKARLLELKNLRPVFPHTLDGADFLMSKLIRVVNRDKKHAESEVCQGSIGYESDQKELHIVNIFRDSIEAFGLTFCPDRDHEFYYVDPIDRDRYIALDRYFDYLKIARVNELKRIAQDLGARHFKVTYKEKETSSSEKSANLLINVNGFGKANAEQKTSRREDKTIEVFANTSFPGHAPITPQLKYLQQDPSIQTLIEMRMNPATPLLHETFKVDMITSSGMNESDAVKIDGLLKSLHLKYSSNTTVASSMKNECRRYLEYDIEF